MKSVLVGLDLTDLDETLISYTSFIADAYNLENVFFLHVAKNLELPEEVYQKYGDVVATVDEGIKHQVLEKVNQSFTSNSSYTIEVEEGNPVERFLRYAKIKNVDAIILGRKRELRGKGIVTHSIARKSPCSLLLVPENFKQSKGKVALVPMDFSEHSKQSLDLAIKYADQTGSSVKCVNIYDVPTGYYKTGKSFEEFSEIMKGHAERDYKNFMKEYDHSVSCEFICAQDHDYEETLITYIEDSKADIVFMGSKGRTNAAVVLMGSMAEKLTKSVNEIPLFVVKKKGESLNIFEALLRI